MKKKSFIKEVSNSHFALLGLVLFILVSTGAYFSHNTFVVEPAEAQVPEEIIFESPYVIGTGVDNETNQIYLVWSEPIRKYNTDKPVDGITLFVNNIQRTPINGGGDIANLGTELYASPLGYDIQSDDLVKVSYSPGENPIISRETGTVATAFPVTVVTNGLTGDTTCPQLQKKLIRRIDDQNIFLGYFDERISKSVTSFQSFGGIPSIKVGTVPAKNSISLSIGSTIATKILEPKSLDWNNILQISINDETTVTDMQQNKACSGNYPLTFDGLAQTSIRQDAPRETTIDTTSTGETTTEVLEATTIQEKPQILKIESDVGSGKYPAGTSIGLTATSTVPLTIDSYIMIELNTGNKKVRLKPTKLGSKILTGSFVVTTSMINESPAKIANILGMKLINSNDTSNTETGNFQNWLTEGTPEYTESNIPNAQLFFVE